MRRTQPVAFEAPHHSGLTTFLKELGRPALSFDAQGAVLRAGAALDVFEIEPLPKDHGLWTAPNTVITPHIAVAQIYQPGTSVDQRGFECLADERVFATTAENIRRFLGGEELLNPVDKAKWF